MAERLTGWTLEHEDWVNMLCGVNGSYDLMAILGKEGENLYTFNEKTGVFKWNRNRIERMGVSEIFEVYNKVIKERRKEEERREKKSGN